MRHLWITPLYVCLLANAQTLTLPDALDQAAKQNPGVQIARLRSMERQAQTEAVKSAYKPQVNIVVGGTYQTNNLQSIGLLFPGFPSRIGPFRTFNARPVVTQTVLDFSLLASIRASRSEAAAAKLDIEAAREETQAAVVSLFLQTFQAQSRLRAAQARLDSANALLKQVSDREQSGGASQLDVARNLQQRQSEQLAVIAAEEELRLLRPALSELLGAAVTADLAEPVLIMPTPAGERPDIRAQELRVEAAQHEVVQAKRERMPRLSAFGDYGALGTGPDRAIGTYNVGATLTIPVWTGGRIEANIEAARQRAEQRKEETRRLRLAAERQGEQAQISYQQQTRSAAAAAESVVAARKVLELARLRYESGLATSVDTVTAQAALAESEEAEIRARYGAQLALAQLAFAKGDVRAAIR
ncbi:MAG: TolC family protein [Bryobacteraceae bacterium]